MGLDIVEAVIRCEEEFGVDLKNDQMERTRTVGGLFELICEELQLPLGLHQPQPIMRAFSHRVIVPTEQWNRDTVWSRIVEICADQFQIDPDEITYSASFVEDLGVD